MGAVFLGIELESSALGVRVESAIKIPDAKLLRNDPTMAAQFVREAQAAARVRHPAVVRLEKVGMVGDIPYIAMELLYGEGLEKTLERGPMPPAEVVAAGIAICGGLDAVHKAGLIHRDLKPSNIFRTTHGEVKLLDLGIAKAMDAATRMTGTGMSKGTPGYMAPEQLEDGKSLDERTDLFALGAVLAELALGEPVFVGETLMSLLLLMSKAEVHVADSSVGPRVNAVCPGLGDVVVACMRQQPSTRPSSAAEVRRALSALSAPAPAPAPSVSSPSPNPEPVESPAPPKKPAATHEIPEPQSTAVEQQIKAPPTATRAVKRLSPDSPTTHESTPSTRPVEVPGARPPAPDPAVESRPSPVDIDELESDEPQQRRYWGVLVAAGWGGVATLGIGTVALMIITITGLVTAYNLGFLPFNNDFPASADISASPYPLVDACDDYEDNDRDGQFDCDDPGCSGFRVCGGPSDAPGDEASDTPKDAFEGDNDGECSDGLDNDHNGLFDCDEPDCSCS